MARQERYCIYAETYRKSVAANSDSDIQRALADLCWFKRSMSNHRLWYRLLVQEAHKRGLRT